MIKDNIANPKKNHSSCFIKAKIKLCTKAEITAEKKAKYEYLILLVIFLIIKLLFTNIYHFKD